MKVFRLVALICLFCTVVTPLVISVRFVFPFIEPKAIWFRGFVDIALGASIAAAILGRPWRPQNSSLIIAFVGVLVALAVADSFSPLPFLAFISRTERMEGFVCFMHLGVFLATAAFLLDTEKLRRRFIAANILVSFFVGLIGLVSYLSFAVSGHGGVQIYSTLGNPVYLGQYAVLACTLCAWAYVRGTRGTRLFYAIAGLINFSMVFLSQGRGAAVAAIAATGVYIFSLLKGRARWYGVVAIIVCFAILVLAPALIPELPRNRRFTEIDWSDPRFMIWRLCFEAIKSRPIFGWGQDGLLLAGGFLVHIDRAHNLLLDWLVAAGVFGAATWGWFLFVLRRNIEKAYQGAERAALYAFLTAYLVTDMFLFDTLPTYMLLLTVAALVAARWGEIPSREFFGPVRRGAYAVQ